jgi:ankyrin repeat protein
LVVTLTALSSYMKQLVIYFFFAISFGTLHAQSCDIWKAIREAEPAQVNACIVAKTDLNAVDAKGRTPLLAAVAADGGLVVPERQKKIVTALLAAGSNVNAVDAKGYSALHYTAYQGSFDLLAMLLEAKADVTLENEAGETPLLLAARGPLMDDGRLQTIIKLLAAGADVKKSDAEGQKALHLICAHDARLESPEDADAMIGQIAQLFAEKGADLKALDGAGNSPFSNAIQSGHFETATWLLDKGATALATTLGSYTAIHIATEKGNLPMVARLLKAGLDINRTTGDKRQAEGFAYFFPKGSTPLDLALISAHEAKNADRQKEWKTFAAELKQRGGVSRTFNEYVKGFSVLKGDSKPGSSKIR